MRGNRIIFTPHFALIANAMCQIWWKCVSCSKKKLLAYFSGHGVYYEF